MDDYQQLLSLRSWLGHVRSNIRYGWKNKGSRPLLVSEEWLKSNLETRAYELEHRIVEIVGVKNNDY